MTGRTEMTAENYIETNKLDGTKIADILREWDDGKALGELCAYYGYNIDAAMGHVTEMEGRGRHE